MYNNTTMLDEYILNLKNINAVSYSDIYFNQTYMKTLYDKYVEITNNVEDYETFMTRLRELYNLEFNYSPESKTNFISLRKDWNEEDIEFCSIEEKEFINLIRKNVSDIYDVDVDAPYELEYNLSTECESVVVVYLNDYPYRIDYDVTWIEDESKYIIKFMMPEE